MARTMMLVCGVLSPIVWLAGDVIASLRYPGYSYVDFSVSELSALGASTRAFVVWVGVVSVLLELALAAALWLVSAGRRGLRTTAVLMFAHAGLNLAIPVINVFTPFATMHTREDLGASGAQAASDIGHLIYVAVTLVLIFLMIGFASSAFGRPWRVYSFATIAVMLTFGAWAGSFAPRVAANLPTPGLGLIERANVYSFYLWFALLAVMVLRIERSAPRPTGGGAVGVSEQH